MVLRIALVLGAVVVAVAAAGEARADRRVFLNGLDLADVEVSDQAFGDCKVRFDRDGDVHITAPGFDVAKREARAPRKRAAADRPHKAALTRRYYLAHQGDRAGKVQFEVAVYINGKRVASFRPGAADGVVEVTRHLRPGTNRVRVVAAKRLGKSGKRRSFSPKDRLKVLLGEGEVARGIVTVRRTVVQVERNASETGTFTDRFEFETR